MLGNLVKSLHFKKISKHKQPKNFIKSPRVTERAFLSQGITESRDRMNDYLVISQFLYWSEKVKS